VPTKLEKDRSSAERRRASLDERAAELAREARKAHEREREIEARETALQYRENQLRRRESELDGDTTNPRLPGQQEPAEKKAPDWNLPTIAATIEEAHAMMQERRRSSGSQMILSPPKTSVGRFFRRIRDIFSANPMATFFIGFAFGATMFLLIWSFAE
jgi:hypothetical protein